MRRPYLVPDQLMSSRECAGLCGISPRQWRDYADTVLVLIEHEHQLPNTGAGKRRHRRWPAHAVALFQKQMRQGSVPLTSQPSEDGE